MLSNYPKVRLGIYLLALLGNVAGIIVGVALPDYGVAIVGAAGVLNAAALGTAVSNIGSSPPPAE